MGHVGLLLLSPQHQGQKLKLDTSGEYHMVT